EEALKQAKAWHTMNSGRLSASVIESNGLRGSEKNLNWVRKSVKQVDVAFSYSALQVSIFLYFRTSGNVKVWLDRILDRHVVAVQAARPVHYRQARPNEQSACSARTPKGYRSVSVLKSSSVSNDWNYWNG